MNLFQYLRSPKLLVTGFGLVLASVLGYGIVTATAAHAQLPQDCDNNSIIYCGFQDKNGFQTAYNQNKYGDLHVLYADSRFGFKPSDMSRFMSSAVLATAYKDGRIVLDDGRVVATNAWSLGRKAFDGQRESITIGNTTYYWSHTQYSFLSNSIRAYVLMDNDNKYMQFAVLTSCGNPITGTKPTFQCDMLQKQKNSDTSYEFWTTATANNGASVQKVHYDFGDGTSADNNSAAAHVAHTYSKPGDYHVTVTVTYNVNGHTQTESVQAKCQTVVSVPQPPKPVFTCDNLSAVAIQGTANQYTFTATGSGTNATLVSGKFDFGDNQNASGIKTQDGKTVITPHQYANAGTYTIKAYLTFDAGTTTETAKCTATVTINQTCANTPNAPECQPKTCQNAPTLPGCQPTPPPTPTQLPSTGPAEIVGSALGLGSIAGAGMYYRGSRKNLIDLILKR